MIKKRRVPLGKPIIWFPEDNEVEADRLSEEMATPDAETIELAKARWQEIPDKYRLMLEAKDAQSTP